jgi:hypothetical protein
MEVPTMRWSHGALLVRRTGVGRVLTAVIEPSNRCVGLAEHCEKLPEVLLL